MLVRVRSRDGLERVQVPDGATLGDLRRAISEALGVALEGLRLSTDPKLLTSAGADFTDLVFDDDDASLASLGVRHGDVLHAAYAGARTVPVAGPPRSAFEARPFGAHMDVAAMVAAQMRVDRQEAPRAAAASFDGRAAHAFQAYCADALGFSVKRGGVLFGEVGPDDGVVYVHAIWEPAQRGGALALELAPEPDEAAAAEAVAAGLGLRRVGAVHALSTAPREGFIVTAQEVRQMAAEQAGDGDERAVTALVAASPGDGAGAAPEVHFEAFQASDAAVRLLRAGWFAVGADGPGAGADLAGVSALRNPAEPRNAAPAVVGGKDAGEVDNDYFLVPVGIRDHAGPLLGGFPVENRLTEAGSPAALRAHLARHAALPPAARLADFHCLLWVARAGGLPPRDARALAAAARAGGELPEGYAALVGALAAM